MGLGDNSVHDPDDFVVLLHVAVGATRYIKYEIAQMLEN